MPTTNLDLPGGGYVVCDIEAAQKELAEAAALLIRDGWTIGTMKDDTGCRCAAGALLDTISGGHHGLQALAAYMRADPGRFHTYRRLVSSTDQITEWNDYYADTQATVVAVLNDAATWITGRPAHG